MNKVMEHITNGLRFNQKLLINNTKISFSLFTLLIVSYFLIVHYNLIVYLPVSNYKLMYLFLTVVLVLYSAYVAILTKRHLLLKHNVTIEGINKDYSQKQMLTFLNHTYETFNQLYRNKSCIKVWTIVKQYHFLKAYCMSVKAKSEVYYQMIEEDLNKKINIMFRKSLKVTILDLLVLNIVPFFIFIRLDFASLVNQSTFVQSHYDLLIRFLAGLVVSVSISILLLIFLYVKLNNENLSITFIRRMLLISNFLGGFSIFRAVGSFSTLLAIKQYEKLLLS